MRKPLFSVLSLIAALGCGLKKSSRPQVGVTLLTETHVFYQNLRRGMQQAADSLGLDLKIVAGGGELARQTPQGGNFLTQRRDAARSAPATPSGPPPPLYGPTPPHTPPSPPPPPPHPPPPP